MTQLFETMFSLTDKTYVTFSPLCHLYRRNFEISFMQRPIKVLVEAEKVSIGIIYTAKTSTHEYCFLIHAYSNVSVSKLSFTHLMRIILQDIVDGRMIHAIYATVRCTMLVNTNEEITQMTEQVEHLHATLPILNTYK